MPTEAKTGGVVETRNYYHFAAWYGREDILKLIYNNGDKGRVPGINAKDRNGSAPIHLAVASNAGNAVHVIETMIELKRINDLKDERSKMEDIDLMATDGSGHTALALAIALSVDEVRIILENAGLGL